MSHLTAAELMRFCVHYQIADKYAILSRSDKEATIAAVARALGIKTLSDDDIYGDKGPDYPRHSFLAWGPTLGYTTEMINNLYDHAETYSKYAADLLKQHNKEPVAPPRGRTRTAPPQRNRYLLLVERPA